MDRKWVVIGLVVLNLLLWGQSGFFSFVTWDDPDFLTENANVTQGLTGAGVVWSLTTQFIYWQPLVFLSHQAMVSVFGLQPGAHHLLNVVLHAAAMAVFFLVLLRLKFPVWTAAIAVAIYSLHPLRAESVAWVTERKDVLSGLFWWLAVWAYLRHAQEGKKYLWVVVFFVLALMAKPVAVTLPVVLLLLDWWPLGRLEKASVRARVMEKLPLAALSVVSAVVTMQGQRTADAVSSGIGIGLRMTNAIHSYGYYLWQTVWPQGLSALYGYPNSYGPAESLGMLAMLAALTWAAWRARARQPWWLVGWAWYLLVLVPNIGIVQVGEQPHADRYTYLSTSMLIACVCYGIGKWMEGPRVRIAAWAGAALAVVYALVSVPVMGQWRNDYTLYGRMLAMDPRLAVAHNNLGLTEKQHGNLMAALREFEEAVKLDPAHLGAHVNAAITYTDLGQPDRALPHAVQAARLAPGRADILLHLGRAQAGTGQLDAAAQTFQRGLSASMLAATTAPLYMQLGVVEYMRKNDEAALTAFHRALEADPQHWPARKNAGIVLGNLGRKDEAIAEFEAYLKQNPGDAEVRQAIMALRGATK